MKNELKMLRTEAMSRPMTLKLVTIIWSLMLTPSRPEIISKQATQIDFTPHAGVAYYLIPKSDKDDRPYHFDEKCWASKVVPEVKQNLRVYAWRTTDLSRRDMEAFITKLFPRSVHSDALKAIRMALPWAEKYCLDPLWVISVIFVESSFRTTSRSVKNAIGPLQLIPETGRLISRKLLGIEDSGLSSLLIKTPETNIQMGLYYFKRVLNFFAGNYEFATVAYNMGPWWVRSKLKNGPYRARGHNYFEKIRFQYLVLLSQYVDWAIKTPPEYESTYVAMMGYANGSLELNAFICAREMKNFLAYIDQIMSKGNATLLAQIER